ncbi:MAG: hypothetical protein ACRDJE_13485 [Dehalococcoidia bacterium]
MPDQRHPEPHIRRAQRVLQMVHELHKRGYQFLRIIPGMSPSGLHWRCTITTRSNILATHGARARDYDADAARYTSGQDNEYFGWTDARQDTARQLATKFVERFPELAEKGRGRDWEYAGWYVEMLGHADRGALPIAYADWDREPDPRWLPTLGTEESGLPMPPGSDAVDRDEGTV